MLRKIFTFLLTIILLMGVSQNGLASAAAPQQIEVPNGYIGIYSVQDLDQVRNKLSGHYILMNDIDLTADTATGGVYFNNGVGWTPIGTEAAPFTGNFDGNGYKIIGLKEYIQTNELIYAGLFGYAKNATITNLGMENNNIYAENTSLDSKTSNVYAGGIVGYGYNVTITNSYTTGTISAPSLFNGYAGGIAGYLTSSSNMSSTVSTSENRGTINAKTAAGGIAGIVYRTNIGDASNKGKISGQGSSDSGGIVGELYSSSTITNSNNAGTITYRSRGGGIAGYSSSSSIRNSYNQGELSSTDSSSTGGGIIGNATGTMISQSYNTGTISSSAKSSDGGGIAGTLSSSSSITDSYNTGNISVDLSAGGIAGNLYGVTSKTYNSGTISGTYVGGIGGWSSSDTIVDSYNIGAIKGKYRSGGIAGYAKNTTFKNTYNIGIVTSSYYPPGGIAGEFDGSIENSYYLNNLPTGVGTGITEGTYQKTYEQMKDSSTFAEFNFSTTWKMDGNSNFHFPILNETPSPEIEKNLDIFIASSPKKLEYVQGETLDLTGASINVRTNFGNQFSVPVTANMVTGFDPTKIGYQSIQVNYKGLVTYFSVEVEYTVSFVDYDGRILKIEAVKSGESATAPDAPTRTGYTFSGWSPDYHNVKKNLTITAQYKINTFLASYMDGDTVIESSYVQYGDWVPRPSTPVKLGYTFLDWYSDRVLQTWYQFYNDNDKVTADVTLYAKFAANPNVPQNLAVKAATVDKVKLTWNPVSGVDGYRIDRADSANGDFYWGYFLVPNTQSYDIDSLQTGKTYYFKISSYRIVDGQYIYSSYSPIISGTPVLVSPASAKAVSTGYDKVTISWAKVDEASGYELYRSDSSNGSYSRVATVTNGLSYVNSSLAIGKTYYYKVRAYQNVGSSKVYSPFSTIVSAAPVLGKITTIGATSSGYNKVKVNWSAVSGASGYQLYRSTSKTGTYKIVKILTSLSQIDSNLTSGTSYYYKVRAYRTIGAAKVYSSFSSIVNASPILAKPTTVTAAKASSTSIKVTWGKVSEASGYEVYRSTAKTGTYSKIKTITSGSSVYYTNTKLAKRKTYYYKVRAYRTVNGKKIYSSFTTIVSKTL